MAAATGIASHRVWAKILEFVFGRSSDTSSLGLNWIFSMLASLTMLSWWPTARNIRESGISGESLIFLGNNVLKERASTVRIRRLVITSQCQSRDCQGGD